MTVLIFDSFEITVLYAGIIVFITLQRRFLPSIGYKQLILLLANIVVLSFLIPLLTIISISVLALFCYGAAVYFQKNGAHPQKKARILPWLTVSILLLIFLWIFLKYDGPKDVLRAAHWGNLAGKIDLISTLGLSYIFFKLIHMLVDAYRGLLPDLNPVTFLNYILFFPTYLSGPIDRYRNFDGWIHRQSVKIDWLLFRAAFFRILVGIVKKFILVPLVISYAKDFGQVHISNLYLINIMISLFAYSFYLYFDFSGYCDLAIGVAMLLGFKVPENFKAPYLARDIGEFWKRWHISLSSILREYIYLPLVRGISKHFNRVPRLAGTIGGYLTTFVICGLWHGNTLNFVFWGLWHGVGLSIHKAWSVTSLGQKLRQVNGRAGQTVLTILSIGMTFCYVSFGWLFFNYSLEQVQSIPDISKLKLSAQPYYFYGNHYTWGIRLKYKPLTANDRIDLKYRAATGKGWINYADDLAAGRGSLNIYGAKSKNTDDSEVSYSNLPPGNYELRLRYKMATADSGHWITLPVTIPDYTSKSNLTADDLEAEAYRLANSGWGIKLKYHPPSSDFKVDVEYRPLGSDSWVRYQHQRPGRYHFTDITGDKQSLKPGVYCIRIRYTNPKEGYFSDWTELAVRVPHLDSNGDVKDEIS